MAARCLSSPMRPPRIQTCSIELILSFQFGGRRPFCWFPKYGRIPLGTADDRKPRAWMGVIRVETGRVEVWEAVRSAAKAGEGMMARLKNVLRGIANGRCCWDG